MLAHCVACAAGGPPVITPDLGEPLPEGSRDLSRGGRERGVLEFTLAGVTAATSATLITFGAVGVHRARELRAYCDDLPVDEQGLVIDDPVCRSFTGDPVVNQLVSAGLSFFFAAPMGVASAFLLRRGLRIHRDYKRARATDLTFRPAPYLTPRGAGLTLTLRF